MSDSGSSGEVYRRNRELYLRTNTQLQRELAALKETRQRLNSSVDYYNGEVAKIRQAYAAWRVRKDALAKNPGTGSSGTGGLFFDENARKK